MELPESCTQCNSPRLYPVKDGGTVFCLDCLFFVKNKKSCHGTCHVRCIRCTYSKERLRALADMLITQMSRKE